MSEFLGTTFFCVLCAIGGYICGHIFPISKLLKRG